MSEQSSDRTGTSISFLDVIACAFGAIVLLVLIIPIGLPGGEQEEPSAGATYGQMLFRMDSLNDEIALLEKELGENQSLIEVFRSDVASANKSNETIRKMIDETRAESSRSAAKMETVRTTVGILSQPPKVEVKEETDKPMERSGIPMDSEYIAFVIDTSGSMQMIKNEVIDQVSKIWSTYPEVKGIQIMSDNGAYMHKISAGRWIPDSQLVRKDSIRRLQSWTAFSNSSPAEGIITAIDDLYRPDIKMAVFVIGDDYQGSGFDTFLNTVDAKITSSNVSTGTLRIHAIGFFNQAAFQPIGFAILMRELTSRYDGAFLALNSTSGQINPTVLDVLDLLLK